MSNRDARISMSVGDAILCTDGYRVITEIGRHTLTLASGDGSTVEVPPGELTQLRADDGRPGTGVAPLEPWWSGLPPTVRQQALERVEVVQEIRTGYRWGHWRLAQEGEPFSPFGDPTVSLAERCRQMAKTLTYEQSADREIMRRVHDGELAGTAVSPRTVVRWVHEWEREGLRGLVDKRATRQKQDYTALPVQIRQIIDDVFAQFDGDVSRLNIATIEAQIRLEMHRKKIADLHVPERLFQEYLSARQRGLGRTTRSHRSNSHRTKSSSHASFAAVHPSHLALDATRADVLVWDEVRERPTSVEILTLISVATRVIVALRVVPRSANSLEAGLVLYDAMRPMSMLVEGTTIDDWRWCGVPQSVDLSDVAVQRSPRRVIPPGRSLQGLHLKPAVRPSSIRCDHGSIFLSDHFMALLDSLGIDLLLSRGSKPTDNAHVERWHETLQRAYQAIPGFKGRNVAERGRRVDHTGEALLTAAELEQHLRRFVALDYHRAWHEGLVLLGAPSARLTPVEMWDAMMAVTGRIDVPQHPDLIYQFLPIRWLTIGHAGVEHRNLAYDAPVLADFRTVRAGTFQEGSRKAPFHYDPRDISRLWFRHPETGRVHEIPWKARYRRDIPMNDWILDRALANIAARGGNTVLKRKTTSREIIAEIGQLTSAEDTAENRAQAYAARLRWEQAQRDHAEVDAAREGQSGEPRSQPSPLATVTPIRDLGADARLAQFDFDDTQAWPDYDAEGDR
jgi:hypothetical protein